MLHCGMGWLLTPALHSPHAPQHVPDQLHCPWILLTAGQGSPRCQSWLVLHRVWEQSMEDLGMSGERRRVPACDAL